LVKIPKTKHYLYVDGCEMKLGWHPGSHEFKTVLTADRLIHNAISNPGDGLISRDKSNYNSPMENNAKLNDSCDL